MLEGLVAWVINNYLGKYVENLNTHQLSIALLKGAVELENLPLRKDALRQVGLPIQVRAGLIGKVKLKIPVTQLTSAPWEIYMEQLYLIAGPLRLTELDEEAEEQAVQDYKLGQLDAIEARWRSENETSSDSSFYASSYSSWYGMSMNFAANIIENLQLKIKDVHLRYEDNVTVDGKVFAAGIQIESLVAQSCDESWNPTFVSCSSKESFKLMEMQGFSVYCNEIESENMWGDLAPTELVAAMSGSFKREFILSPVHSHAHVKRNRSEKPLRSKNNPRIVCDLTLDQVPLSLSDRQYQLMVGCKHGLVNLARRHGHLRSRPKAPVSADPRAWWTYAIHRVVKPAPTWSSTLARARENLSYVTVYSKLLSNPTDPLSKDDKAVKDKVEWEREYDELKELREISMRRVRPPESGIKAEGSVGLLASWFPGWWQSSQKEPQEEKTDPDTVALEEKILDALADTVENNTILKRDTVFGQFNFTLKKGAINLCSESEALMELQFENVNLGFESRPRTGSHCFQVTLGALFLKDHLYKDSAFPVLIAPQKSESAPSGRPGRNLPPGLAKLATQGISGEKEQPLFQLCYEYKPFNTNVDRKLEVHSKSLDIVYNPGATKWILEFFTSPHQAMDSGLRQAARQGYNAVKKKTKQQLLSNWESIVHGHAANRKMWDVELDISAPQIFLVEHFNDKNAILCVVDFGKLHFTNRIPGLINIASPSSTEAEEEEDEEAFQTPCSTPPGSEVSSLTCSRNPSVDNSNINELQFHDKLYDKYTIDLCDLQILVGCVRDNWKFAHLRGTSTLHILDKFNISLLMERRVVHTIDPQYPSLTLTGNLPKLVAHVNEDKVKAVQTLINVISGKGLISPLRSQEGTPSDDSPVADMDDTSTFPDDEKDTTAKLLMLQFSIDQMALEVQSRGRSVAELQVNGVKASFQKRPYDTSLSLSVHGLLLVDALQTFGPDFELLIASHKHVGMDTVKGSLQDSEPTSPVSPASPEPEPYGKPKLPTSPMAISKALSSISDRAKSPVGRIPSPPQIKIPPFVCTEFSDVEALISVELTFVNADCPTNDVKEHLQIANIQFNNLDIIANQETIVELVGFVHRVFPKHKSSTHFTTPQMQADTVDHGEMNGIHRQYSEPNVVTTRTQLTFDFHRLNVLLLRAVLKDGGLVGRKIATATMTEAKIHASVGTSLEVEGSLGGLQVLDLTPEGHTHQRILSLGEDPLTEKTKDAVTLAHMAAEMYNMSGGLSSHTVYNNQAFSFSVKRTTVTHDTDVAEIMIRMASVWYIHSPHILYELKSCAVEFKQYLSNLFMSIKSAATEVAMGIVQCRAESLAQSLSMSMGGRLYGSSGDVSQTPRKRRSLSYSSTDHLESSRGSVTPHSPAETACNTIIKWDVVLASPVVVVPRSTSSPQVVVAYLGSISVTNSGSSPISSPWGISPYNSQKYNVCITSMNLYTLDISKRIRSTLNLSESSLMRAEELYCSRNDGIPVLHNTSIQLTVVRELSHIRMKQNDDILLESGADFLQIDHQEALQVQGSTVNALKLSLTREQYEQLLETVDRILTPIKGESEERDPKGLSNIEEEPDINTGVSTLSMDSALRARMMAHSAHKIPPLPSPQSISITVGFELPLLSLELIADLGSGQQKLVDLSFKELIVQFEKSHSLETSIQISLNSVAMEDLQKPADSRHRFIMVSSHPLGGDINCYQNYISKSCPNLSSPQGSMHLWHSSLPDHLETGEVLGAISTRHRHIVAAENSIENRMKGTQPKCPYTPPPSPRGKMSPNVFREDNLVHVNIVLKPSRHSKMIQSRQVTVDFNSLDVIVNVESWVVVLDFFGISDIDEKTHVKNQQQEPPHTPSSVKSFPGQLGFDSELEITVKSLSVVLNRAEYEVARAVMTNLSSRLVSMAGSDLTQTEASVGSFTLFDLTPHHSNLYREKFITAGLKLSMSKYNSPDILKIRPYDIQMKLDMVSLVYVHTQRYVSEIQAFFNLFPHLRREVGYFRGNVLEDDVNAISTRVLMEIHAPSPIIILPMSSQSSCALVADLGNLSICNSLKMSGSEGIISKSSNSSKETLLDVMNIMLESMDIVTGERVCEVANASDVPVGGYAMRRKGSSLLKEKCHLKLQVERNLMKFVHTVPDLTIHGNLSTLAARLTLSDYQLISGLLSFNIGECLDDLQLPEISPVIVKEDDYDHVWTCTSMKFELVDVSVALVPNSLCDLACINFIKSSLTVDNYSNRTQDIDLVSQEILITDIRFLDKPANKRSNVFTNILQPIQSFNESETVQAQIHHRKYVDSSKFTILLNNMRLMAIVDWWEAVRDFIMTKPDSVHAVSVPRSTSLQNDAASPRVENPETPYELKLNITDSEIVVVEDSSQWDTNAVILKSTTVITYRPTEIMKPVSCNLNHCEMFSCILGMEDETALSIIDPVTVNMEIIRKQDTDGLFQKVLRVHMAHLSLRLSYHDVRMFHQMLQSLPQQTQYARSQVAAQHPANFRYQLDKLRALGFRLEDCSEALCKCNGQLDDAALWLTQNAIPISSYQGSPSSSPHHSHLGDSMLSFSVAEVETDSVCLCIIDDCQDADVPLLEFSLTKLEMKQDLDKRSGIAAATLSIHYYNRLLSGWEPFVEPWSCNLCWDCLSQTLTKTRIELTVASSETLNMNITSTLVELYNSVKEIWTQDYYSQKESLTRLENVEMKNNLSSPPGYRRRSPFVPFAIKNDTGSRLFFSTITSGEESVIGHKPFRTSEDILNWTVVEPNGTVPFSFTERGRGRHRDTHKFRSHQVRVKVEGWMSTSPVTVDRVGVFFREAFPDIQFSTQDMPLARIVLEVTLEGSARKLITVRSALQIYNKLDHMVEVKLNNAHLQKSSPVHLTVTAGDVLSVPLTHAMAVLYARPLDPNQYYSFSTRPITWKLVNSPEQMAFETRQCNTNANIPFRFCVAIKRENYPIEKSPPLAPGLAEIWTQPAHVLTLLPPLTIVNLLPYELYYTIRGSPIKGKKIVKPGQKHSSCEVDLEKYLELIFNLENFPSGGSLQIPEFTNGFTTRVRLQDQTGRRLHLQAQIYSNPGASIKVVISAPYWLVNKTALPIVFKQEGVTAETAGQYEEHEVARMVAPLLFSFSDIDASPTVIARVGNGVHPEGFPQWCRHFTLQPGVQVRRLKVSLRENRPDLVYMIGIEIRQGKGRYRPTKIVTLSAHYQIHNKSSYKLQFAQRCFASTVSDPGAEATYLTAVPNCYLPFHWPRLDKDQLLCLRILDVPQCLWSGGFKIDSNTSFHLNIRDQSGRMYFLRIEIVLQGATFFIVLTDADTMPPPIRIDNFSKVPITIHQAGLSNCVSTVKAGNSTPYAWDEPIRAQILTVTAPGGVSAEYNLNRLGDGPGLTYENFIYIAFTATFKNSKGDKVDVLDVENQQLVLDVPDPTTGRVVLSQKQAGARSQLWRMTADGHLQHEGSSPPRALSDKVMVLDIYGPAPQPTQYVGLVIRRPDRRRVSTQSWKFTEDGRLCCAHSSMCVQAKDGFFGLHKGSEVVLGPPQAVTYQTTDTGIPLEQAVSRQRLRPGSGFLSVCVSTDGPTRVLQITDIKEKRVFTFADEGAWINVTDSSNSARRDEVQNKEMQITMSIPVVGISLISRNPPEELVYIYLSTVKLEVLMQNRSELLDLSIQDIQIDNQVFEAQCPVTLYVSPISRSSDPEEGVRPAVSISAEKTLNKYSYNADIFKHLFIRVKNMSLIIDERLLLKLFQFIGWNSVESNESADESDFETQRILAEASSVHAKRYYFGALKILFTQVRLSFITCSKLDPELQAIKRKLGLTLIKFEDANVELQPFSRQHSFENNQILFNSIIKHYKDELKWQAGIILGSVDFLGNPIGFVNDLSEGVSGLIYEGNVGALVKNVAHGLSNSAAKVTETLGDGIGLVILDDRHEEMRQRIRSVKSGSSGEHLVAGLKGLGFGLLGGVTSLVKQTYDGAASDGFQGLIAGLGKGLVGTVTKPVVGVLDLASETATAVRDSSRSSSKQIPPKKRAPRCVTSPAGFLPPYNKKQSQGQQYLYSINHRNYKELFMAYEVLRSGMEDLRIVISSETVRVFSCTNSSNGTSIVFERQLGDLEECKPITVAGISTDPPIFYIELKMRDPIGSIIVTQEGKRPRVRCDSEGIATWVSQQINYAKERYIERQNTLVSNCSGQSIFDD